MASVALKIIRKLVGILLRFLALLIPARALRLKSVPVTETIDALINSKKSLIRWGDGETAIIFGGDIHFQKANHRLRIELLKILLQYSKESHYFLAIPATAFLPAKRIIRSRQWSYWYLSRILFFAVRIFRPIWKNLEFLDSHTFRTHEGVHKDWVPIDPSHLLSGYEHIVVVCNSRDLKKITGKLKAKHYSHIYVPSLNAFDKVDEIWRVLFERTTELEKQKVNFAVVLSAGPLAKILAFNLAPSVVAYDLGHFHEVE